MSVKHSARRLGVAHKMLGKIIIYEEKNCKFQVISSDEREKQMLKRSSSTHLLLKFRL